MHMKTNNTELSNFRNSKAALYAAIILGAALFALLAFMIATNGSVSWDRPLQAWVFSHRSPGLTTLMEAVTYIGSWYSITVIVLLLLIYPNTRRDYGVPAAFAAVISQLIKIIFKTALCRPRPDAAFRLVEEGGWSFPSGHSITAMAVFGLLFFALLKGGGKVYGAKKKALLVCCAVLPFAIGFSRVYLGVHYPSDVLAGWAAGISVIALTILLRPVTDRASGALDDLQSRIIGPQQ